MSYTKIIVFILCLQAMTTCPSASRQHLPQVYQVGHHQAPRVLSNSSRLPLSEGQEDIANRYISTPKTPDKSLSRFSQNDLIRAQELKKEFIGLLTQDLEEKNLKKNKPFDGHLVAREMLRHPQDQSPRYWQIQIQELQKRIDKEAQEELRLHREATQARIMQLHKDIEELKARRETQTDDDADCIIVKIAELPATQTEASSPTHLQAATTIVTSPADSFIASVRRWF